MSSSETIPDGSPTKWQRTTPRKSQDDSEKRLALESLLLVYVSAKWVQSARDSCGTPFIHHSLQNPCQLPPWSSSLMDTYSKP